MLGTLSTVPSFLNSIQVDHFIFLVSFFAISIAITFIGTSLIILSILLVTQHNPPTTHTSGYFKIQRVLVESGIVYTIAMFITGVTLGIQLIVPTTVSSMPLNELATYTEAVLIPLSVSQFSSVGGNQSRVCASTY